MNDVVTVSFVPEQLVTWILIGMIAGVFAGLLIRGRGLGFTSNVVVGMLGAILGGLLFSVLRLPIPFASSGGITLAWSDIFVAFIGAVLILLVFGGFYHGRRLG